MNKKEKGFTLTEVLATLVILGVLIAIAIPSVSKLQEKFKKDYYDNLESAVLASAKTYFKDNVEERPKDILDYSFISYDDLKGKKYIDKINKYNSNEPLNGKVVIVKLKDDYIYEVCNETADDSEICKFSNDDKIEYLISNAFIGYNREIYIHVNTYSNDELRELLGATKTVVRKNKDGMILYEVDLDGEKIYPTNISSLIIDNIDDEEVKRTLKYSNNEEDDVTAILFQHPAPLVNNKAPGVITVSDGENLAISMPPTEANTFDANYKSNFKYYQYSIDGGNSWKELECEKECQISNTSAFKDKDVIFRVIGEERNLENNNKEQIGKESDVYNIKINEVQTVNVSFDANGGSVNPTSMSVTYGLNYGTLPTPTRTGYTFNGWYTSASDGTKVTESTKVETATDHTLYAHWEANLYIVSFNSNGGSSIGSMAFYYNEMYGKYGPLPIPTKSGCSFDGWYTSKEGGTKITETDKVTAHRTLYAHWTSTDYTVTFFPNGDNVTLSPTSKSVTYGLNYGTLPTPTRIGYTFDGWYTSASGGDKVTASTTVTEMSDHILYAHWEAKIIKITLNNNGGYGGTDAIYEKYGVGLYYDSNAQHSLGSSISIPLKDGYKFKRYYGYIGSDGTYGTNLTDNGNYKAFTQDTELTAEWEPKIIKITLNKNGGSGGTSVIYQKYRGGLYLDATLNTPIGTNISVPSKAGHKFKAYPGYIGSDGTYGINLTGNGNYTAFTQDTELIAEWEPKIIKITLNKNGGYGGTDVIYQKYGVGLYSDSNAQIPLGSNISIPTRAGYKFKDYPGYIGSDGTYGSNLTNNNKYKGFTEDTELKAEWETSSLPQIILSANDYSYNTVTSATNSAVCVRAFVNPNGNTINRVDYNVSGPGINTSNSIYEKNSIDPNVKMPSGYDDYFISCYSTEGTYTVNATLNYSGGSINATTLTIKIDKTKPTINLEMKKVGYSTFDSSKSYEDYISNSQYEGYVYLNLKVTDSLSEVSSKKCTVTGADANRVPGNTSFSSYRHIMNEGLTTIECRATDKAGNSSLVIAYVNLKNHTHNFSTWCIGNSNCANYQTIQASTYWTTYYKDYNPSYYDWTCTSGHNHRTYSNNTFYVRKCTICGKNAKEINKAEGTDYATWWCPGSSSQRR